MRRTRVLLVVALALAPAALARCNFQEVPPGGGGGPSQGGGGGSGGDGAAPDSATGGNCTIQTSSGVMLCEQLSLCPKLTVNQNSFAGCGFLVSGKALDLECECSGYLCSAGATSCASAGEILSTLNANVVCGQLGDGGCSFEGLSGFGGSGS